MRRRLLPSDNKYSRGVVGIVAGSSKFPGAALLTVGGARRGDAGYVKFVSADKGLCDLVVARFPDVVPIKSISRERFDALVIGPGAGALPRLPTATPLVLDSAAIAAVRTTRFSAGQIVVVTPHEGELRYLGIEPSSLDSEQRRRNAIEIADKYGVICVLKGNRTVIAAPRKKFLIDKIGGPELACAGSGDLLAGLIGSFLVRVRDGADAFDQVCAAVQTHSKAGRYARRHYKSITALEIMESLALV